MEPIKLEGPDACLAFLIEYQDKWGPQIELLKSGNMYMKPGATMTLIGVVVNGQ